MFVAAPSSLLSLVQLAPTPSYMHEFIRTKTCGDEPSPSVEQNLIGSLVGKPARLTTGYTISLSKHVLQLIYIALSYNLSTDPRPTPIAHRGRGRRPACSPAAHSARQRLTCYILICSSSASARRRSRTLEKPSSRSLERGRTSK